MGMENKEGKIEKLDSAGGKNKEKEMSRREFLKKLGIGLAGVAVLCSDLEKVFAQEESIPSRYEKHGWFYTLEEMKKVYEEEYNAPEKLLEKTLYRENGKWMGVFRKEKFEVPQEFIDKTLKQFKDMLKQGTAKFLFRLDAFHCHFFMDEKRDEME